MPVFLKRPEPFSLTMVKRNSIIYTEDPKKVINIVVMTVADALKRENNNLDLVRIILATTVIFGHTFYLNGTNSAFWIDPIRYLTHFTYSGALAVKVFFFVSGLVVTNSLLTKQNPVAFIISRVFRIFPGFLLVIILTALFICPFLSTLSYKDYFHNAEVYKYVVGNSLLNLRAYLPGVFHNNFYPDVVNGSLWSLRYEAGCYLGLLIVFMITRKKMIYNVIIFAILFDSVFYPHFFRYALAHSRDSNLLPLCFAIGSCLAINAQKIKLTWWPSLVLLILFILFRRTANGEILLILFACYTVLLIAVNKHFKKIRPRYDISYGIYLWGFLIQQILFSIYGYTHGAVHFAMALLIAVIIAFASYVFVEQPCIKLGKQLSLVATRKLSKYNLLFFR